MSIVSGASGLLEIRLNETVVGYLTHFPDNRHLFLFDERYRLSGPERPVLSLSFTEPGDEAATERKLGRTVSSAIRLPQFFSNLLPEGALREYLAKRLKIHAGDEFALLVALGEHLPGAVRAIPSKYIPDSVRRHPLSKGKRRGTAEPAYFSLGGAQMKFSMIEHAGRFTLSAGGEEWIVKPPHQTFTHVPENEFSMMKLAAAAGVEIPEVQLVRMEQVDLSDLPGISYPPHAIAYAIRRYDREANGRVHAEDFAQVFGVYPEREYDATNYDTIGRVLFSVLPRRHEALEEFIRRLVVHILIGNADAHLKNWSIIYPDGRSPRLAPAYDLLSTIQYTGDTRLALNLAGEKELGVIGTFHFRKLARRIGAEEAFVMGIVEETSKTAQSIWPDLLPSLPLPKPMRERLVNHWKNCPVFGL